MSRCLPLILALAALTQAQDTSVPTIDINTIPTITITDNMVTASDTTDYNTLIPPTESTQEVVTLTGVACIPEESQMFSIQTDTVIQNGPLTVTPVCGQSVTPTGTETGSMTTAVLQSGTINGTSAMTSGSQTGSTTGSTTSVTQTTGSGSAETSAPAQTTQSGSLADRVAVGGGIAGVLGLVAGVLVL